MNFYKWYEFVTKGKPGDKHIQGGCSAAPVGTETKTVITPEFVITVLVEGGGELFDTETEILVRELRKGGE